MIHALAVDNNCYKCTLDSTDKGNVTADSIKFVQVSKEKLANVH